MPNFSVPVELRSRSGIDFWADRYVELMPGVERELEARLENEIGPVA